MEQWYVLHTKPQQEARVAGRLDELGIETLLPRVRPAPDRRPVAYFPCYLFASLDLDIVPAARWQWTPGLRRIVSFDGRAAAVPPALIGLIRDKMAQLQCQGAPSRPRFKPGDAVRITHGPMADMVALFERECAPAERVVVLLTFLGRTCRVRLRADDLAEVSPDGARSVPVPAAVPVRRSRRTRGHGRRIGRPV